MFHAHITCHFLALWTNAKLRIQVSDLRLTLHRLLGIIFQTNPHQFFIKRKLVHLATFWHQFQLSTVKTYSTRNFDV